LTAVLAAAGCGTRAKTEGEEAAAANPKGASTAAPEVSFQNVAAEVGIDFVHNTGAFGQKWLPETMGSGCAWVDYDLDGDPDLLLLSGMDFAGHPTGRRQTCAFYRNDGGKFVDVTRETGFDKPMYAMGATFGDYDSDGDPDVYIAALGPDRLYRNDGGKFLDVAKSLGVDDPGFGSSASWFDPDKDGDLDLWTLNYVQWTPETDIFCSLDGTNKSYCTPEAYQGAAARFFVNERGRFVDRTKEAGVHDQSGKALGLVCFDFDGDGWDDVFVSNDTQPNFLYKNNGNGSFTEQGMIAGIAYDEAGRARGAMGVDIADYDGTGRPSMIIGNFSNEMLSLYHNEGNGFFIDAAPTSEVGHQSLLTLAFGTLFLDVNLDRNVDIFVANGHVENEIQKVQSRVSYAQSPHLFMGLGGGKFDDVAPKSETLGAPMVARGAAYADYDGDGDLDILVTTNGGPAKLFRNDGTDGKRSIRIQLVGGAGTNRDGYGAKVALTAGGRTQTSWCRAGHSYCSQSENVLTFGLGDAAVADEITVTWPSGKTSKLTNVAAGSKIVVKEAEASPAATPTSITS
jgi:hypothetical protein